jgi:HTH-type transcriptional regulator, sugar sensing transcriptional regulator
MNKDIESKLQALGLSKNEAAVYIALLKVGQTSAGKIIEKTNLHRSVVYETLHKLTDRKMVFQLDKKRIAYFQATDPARILQDILAKEEIAQEIMPALKILVDTKLPEIKIYEGVESYREFWMNSFKTLPRGSTDYVAGSIGKKWQEHMGEDVDKFLKLRVERQIQWKMIIFEKDDVEFDIFKKYPKLHDYRFINKKFSRTGNFNIFNNDTLILHLAVEPMIIEIKNVGLATAFRNIFDILWEMGKEVK